MNYLVAQNIIKEKKRGKNNQSFFLAKFSSLNKQIRKSLAKKVIQKEANLDKNMTINKLHHSIREKEDTQRKTIYTIVVQLIVE